MEMRVKIARTSVRLLASIGGEVASHHSQRAPSQNRLLPPVETQSHSVAMLIAIWKDNTRLGFAENR
jgi:hypothetical protein